MRNTRTVERFRRRFRLVLAGGPAFTVDLSSQGFCAELLRTPGVGSQVQGTIRVREEEYPFTGKVVWTRPGDAWLNLRGRVGVRFTEVAGSAATASRLQAALEAGEGPRRPGASAPPARPALPHLR